MTQCSLVSACHHCGAGGGGWLQGCSFLGLGDHLVPERDQGQPVDSGYTLTPEQSLWPIEWIFWGKYFWCFILGTLFVLIKKLYSFNARLVIHDKKISQVKWSGSLYARRIFLSVKTLTVRATDIAKMSRKPALHSPDLGYYLLHCSSPRHLWV